MEGLCQQLPLQRIGECLSGIFEVLVDVTAVKTHLSLKNKDDPATVV